MIEAADPVAKVTEVARKWAMKLLQMPESDATTQLVKIREVYPQFAIAVERKYNELKAETPAAGNFGGFQANPSTLNNVNMGSPTGRGTPRNV